MKECGGMRIRSSEEIQNILARLNIYKYEYIEGPIIIRQHVELFKDAINKGQGFLDTTLDLGFTSTRVEIKGYEVYIEGYVASIKGLDEEIREGFLYKIIEGKLYRLDMFRDGNYYKLKPTSINTAPTIEINGIQMHRTINIDPWRDAYNKTKTLGRVEGLRVLEIGSGLGYTASNLLRLGASMVVSIEKDPNVLYLARMNPWSRMLSDERIKLILGDAVEIIRDLCDQCFHKILHDPPRINIAEDLYSLEFYKELYRVLKSPGSLFHYTGEPGRHSNISYLKGVKERLAAAGFKDIRWVDTAQGYIAFKY
ncbi:MAG: hypothetical protein QXP18_08015 [Sulfolobales archaeon]